MLNPSPVDLLARVADVLATEVAPLLEDGPAREQVDSAVALLRRIARALPVLTGTVLADIADIADIATVVGHEVGDDLADGAGAVALPAGLPTLEELLALDLRLRDALAERIEASATDPPSEVDTQLRALLHRMNERDAALRLSPWER